MREKPSPMQAAGRYVILGVVTAAPLAITWFIIDFLFHQLSRIGRPMVNALAASIATEQPIVAAWLHDETFLSILAAMVIVALLAGLGWMTSHVVGRRLIAIFEALIVRIPFVDTLYRAIKRFLTVASPSSGSEQRVVLIDFTSSGVKSVGLVTSYLTDANTGEQLAAVFVPMAPNPTGGFVDIVPVKALTFTDWTFDQAMSFLITAGSQAPDAIAYGPISAEAASGRAPPPPVSPPGQP